MENEKSELEKKLEENKESTAPDSEIIRSASIIPSSEEISPEEETVSKSNSLGELSRLYEEQNKELEELKDRYLRVCAEFDNYRKRTMREIKEIREVATEQLIKDLLPVLDNFERALQHVPEPEDAFVSGVRMVFTQLKDTLLARGLLTIEAVGQPFNPNVHEAIAQIESEQPEGTVVQEYEKGYLLGKHVLRPAKVVVSKSPEQKSQDEESSQQN